jgi:hypothetical protein
MQVGDLHLFGLYSRNMPRFPEPRKRRLYVELPPINCLIAGFRITAELPAYKKKRGIKKERAQLRAHN